MVEPREKPVILADTQQQVRLSMRRQLLHRDECASACMECTQALQELYLTTSGIPCMAHQRPKRLWGNWLVMRGMPGPERQPA